MKYKPGSREARENGCTCPVLDNNFGEGYFNDGKIFVYNMECPLHKETGKAIKTPFEKLLD
jgi:hypothetical protein